MNGLILLALIQVTVGAAIIEKKASGCPLACDRIEFPICGSDGRTYANECTLRSANKCDGHSVHMTHLGACGAGRRAPCSHNMIYAAVYDPVCGSDGKTYSNECSFHSRTCGSGLTVIHKGAC